MPNHIYNILEMSDNYKAIKKLVKSSKEQEMDFNNIIPMPEELKGTTSPLDKKAKETQKQFDERMEDNMKKYGTKDWYDWSCKFWGTKWNAYDVITDNEDCICFNTAWSTPEPVVKALSKLFPKTEFTMKYADEDLGSNCGTYIYKNGKLISDKEGDLEFACELQGVECSTCPDCGEKFANWEEETKCWQCLEKENNK